MEKEFRKRCEGVVEVNAGKDSDDNKRDERGKGRDEEEIGGAKKRRKCQSESGKIGGGNEEETGRGKKRKGRGAICLSERTNRIK